MDNKEIGEEHDNIVRNFLIGVAILLIVSFAASIYGNYYMLENYGHIPTVKKQDSKTIYFMEGQTEKESKDSGITNRTERSSFEKAKEQMDKEAGKVLN